jgi:hypothetical protein
VRNSWEVGSSDREECDELVPIFVPPPNSIGCDGVSVQRNRTRERPYVARLLQQSGILGSISSQVADVACDQSSGHSGNSLVRRSLSCKGPRKNLLWLLPILRPNSLRTSRPRTADWSNRVNSIICFYMYESSPNRGPAVFRNRMLDRERVSRESEPYRLFMIAGDSWPRSREM